MANQQSRNRLSGSHTGTKSLFLQCQVNPQRTRWNTLRFTMPRINRQHIVRDSFRFPMNSLCLNVERRNVASEASTMRTATSVSAIMSTLVQTYSFSQGQVNEKVLGFSNESVFARLKLNSGGASISCTCMCIRSMYVPCTIYSYY